MSVALHRQGGNLRLDFPFPSTTPAAVFRRGNVMWAVFDSASPLNISALRDDKTIKRAALVPGREDEIILRLVLDKPQLASFFPEGTGWTLIIGESVVEPTAPIRWPQHRRQRPLEHHHPVRRSTRAAPDR